MWWFDLGPVIYIIRRQTAPLRAIYPSNKPATPHSNTSNYKPTQVDWSRSID